MPSSVGACATGPRIKRVGFGLGLRPFAGNAPNLDFEKIRKKSHPFFRLRRRLATAQGHSLLRARVGRFISWLWQHQPTAS